MRTTLLADIGGSKSRFALAKSAGAPERMLVIENDTVADLDAAVARYLEETGARPRAATLAVAGPVDGEEIALTNRTSWRLRRREFAKRFGFAEEFDVERKFRETRLYQTAPISTNLILSYLAEHVLGLPRSY